MTIFRFKRALTLLLIFIGGCSQTPSKDNYQDLQSGSGGILRNADDVLNEQFNASVANFSGSSVLPAQVEPQGRLSDPSADLEYRVKKLEKQEKDRQMLEGYRQ